jgi:hypothetical protein
MLETTTRMTRRSWPSGSLAGIRSPGSAQTETAPVYSADHNLSYSHGGGLVIAAVEADDLIYGQLGDGESLAQAATL